MPAVLSNASNFLFTSDYPIDKVVYLTSGSFPMTASGTGTLTITHGLGFTPLIGGYWSLTSDFSIIYELNSGTFPSTTPGSAYERALESSWSNSTSIAVNWYNNSTAATAYYRIYAFAPPSVSPDLASLASSADQFTISTEYNYMKLYDASEVTGIGTAATYTITHNLGKRPRIDAWVEFATTAGKFFPVVDKSLLGIEMTTTSLIIHNTNLDDIKTLSYRLYLDE